MHVGRLLTVSRLEEEPIGTLAEYRWHPGEFYAPAKAAPAGRLPDPLSLCIRVQRVRLQIADAEKANAERRVVSYE
jgi:hypothetical protein